jgi:uncharacterized protein involved in exopolysaccharide biosynthesis
MPNFYKSEIKILPDDSKSQGVGNLAAAAAAFGVSVPGGDSADSNFVEILLSRWMAERLLESEFKFKAKTWRFGAEKEHLETLSAFLHSGNPDRELGAVRQMLSVSRDLKSKVITLSVETISPTLSQEIAKRSLVFLEGFVRQKGRTRGGAKAAFAEARLREAREEMRSAEDEFRKFAEGNRNYQSSSEPAVKIRGARLESELKLRQQLIVTLSMNREQALLEEKNDIPILNVLDAGNLPFDKSRPTRANFVLFSLFLGSLATWIWQNRAWLKARLVDENALTTQEKA